MQPILAIDFDGALLKSRPFKLAHEKWFEVMANLLGNEQIKGYANLENYFDKVHEVMESYLGEVEHETRVRFARLLYAMATIAEVRKEDLCLDFVEYLKELKAKYKLALITNAPDSSVKPILQKLGIIDLFDILITSSDELHPDKKTLFKVCIDQYGKPEYYIGNGDKHIKTCKQLEIKTISVNWVCRGEFKGEHDVEKVGELKDILG